MLTRFEVVFAIAVAVCSLLGVLASFLRWIYHRGASSANQATSIDANTEANQKLSASFDKFIDKTDGILMDHEQRIIRMEAQRVP